MYQLGRSTHHSHKIAAAMLFLLICGVVFGIVWLYRQLQPETTVSQSQPQTTTVSVPVTPTKTVKGDGFTIRVPKAWKSEEQNVIYNVFAWRGASKEDATRLIQVYVDNFPAKQAFNRLQPVKADADGLVLAGDVSENCVNFTDRKNTNKQTGAAPAKWSGIDFFCDMGNSARNVIGTGSSDGINFVQVTGESGKTHRFLLAYTDHSAEPDNNVFTDIIDSFRAL